VDCGLRIGRGLQLGRGLRIACALLLLGLCACRQVPPLPESALKDLTSVDQFSRAFNADVSLPRLLVIVSPT
jgi:hypothetical protein